MRYAFPPHSSQAHDLLEVHALELERVTDDLDKELRRNNPDAGGLASGRARSGLAQPAQHRVRLGHSRADLFRYANLHALRLPTREFPWLPDALHGSLTVSPAYRISDAGLTDYLNDFAIDAVAPATARGKTPRLDDFNAALQQELQGAGGSSLGVGGMGMGAGVGMGMPGPGGMGAGGAGAGAVGAPAGLPPVAPAPAKKTGAAAAVASKGKRPRDEDGGGSVVKKKAASVANMQLATQVGSGRAGWEPGTQSGHVLGVGNGVSQPVESSVWQDTRVVLARYTGSSSIAAMY